LEAKTQKLAKDMKGHVAGACCGRTIHSLGISMPEKIEWAILSCNFTSCGTI
jgi:hypothetical protein